MTCGSVLVWVWVLLEWKSNDDYSGTGFAYDFLLGTSYRLSDNWSLQADYRYYLTAAHDNYDHVKSHLWLLSASLDL